jgi:hypothetical protein
MSALERFSQRRVSSSYCESRVVSGETPDGATVGGVWLVCCIVAV